MLVIRLYHIANFMYPIKNGLQPFLSYNYSN